MKIFSRRLCAFAVVSMLYGTTAQAQIYECIDARGAREFAKACAPGTVRERLLVRGDDSTATAPAANSAKPPAPAAKTAAQQEVEFKKRQLERQDAEAKAGDEREKAEEAERNCALARAQLRGILEGQRMMRIDPETGERVNFDDAERAAEAENQKKMIEQWCK